MILTATRDDIELAQDQEPLNPDAAPLPAKPWSRRIISVAVTVGIVAILGTGAILGSGTSGHDASMNHNAHLQLLKRYTQMRNKLKDDMSPSWNGTMPLWKEAMRDLDTFMNETMPFMNETKPGFGFMNKTMPGFGSVWNVTMPHFGSTWNMTRLNLTSMSNASTLHSVTKTIETVIKDGHMVKTTRTCKNGKCETTTKDKKLVTTKDNSVSTQKPPTF